MSVYWPYYILRSDGILVDESGYVAFPIPYDEVAAELLKSFGKKFVQTKPFNSAREAESWLEEQNLRGYVR